MALLNEYGEINHLNILDYQTHYDALQSIIALSAFPIVEEKQTVNSVAVIAYEKSFWSKKQKGIINLEYIQNAKLDLSQINNGDEHLPEYAEVLIGININSEYNRITIPGNVKTYEIGEPRAQLLSYGKLLEVIELHYNTFSQIQLDELKSASPLGNYLSGNFGFSAQYQLAEKELKELRQARSKLDFFKRFL